jgi:hypothetical protein
MVKVSCKPITSTAEDYQKQIIVDRKNPEPRALILDNYRPDNRIGAFEVQLCTKVDRNFTQELLHSKLNSRKWPTIRNILEKISKYIPHTNINVKLYTTSSEGVEHSLKSKLFYISVSLDIKVKLIGKQEKLDEIANNLNNSLTSIEEKKLLMMRSQKNFPKLPQVDESPNYYNNRLRPVSATTKMPSQPKEKKYTIYFLFLVLQYKLIIYWLKIKVLHTQAQANFIRIE